MRRTVLIYINQIIYFWNEQFSKASLCINEALLSYFYDRDYLGFGGLKKGRKDFLCIFNFSDHSIYPTDADHYRLYWGDDREALLDEVTNLPTYSLSDMSDKEIVHAMTQLIIGSPL